MRMSLCLFRVAALLLIPLLAVSPRAVAGFIPTLYNLSDEGSRRLEAARRDLEGKIVRHYLMARGQQEEAAAKAAAAMSDEQRRKTIDVEIPKYIKGSSATACWSCWRSCSWAAPCWEPRWGGSSSHCDDDDYNHNRYCCP